MKCVITGGRGQLAQELLSVLSGSVWAAPRSTLDITSSTEMYKNLKEYGPDVVINCAAYNQVDQAEVNSLTAFSVNGLALKNIARYCSDNGARLVHFSTDQVFGINDLCGFNIPFSVDDPPMPVNTYGISKLVGECYARAYNKDTLIIRTCGLYGNKGEGKKPFPKKILELAKAGKPLYIVEDQVCTPTYTLDLATMVKELLKAFAPPGIYHVTNTGECSWYQFAGAVLGMARQDACLIPVTSDWYSVHRPGTATRPKYSVLDQRMPVISQFTQYRMRSWQAALSAYMQELVPAKPQGEQDERSTDVQV